MNKEPKTREVGEQDKFSVNDDVASQVPTLVQISCPLFIPGSALLQALSRHTRIEIFCVPVGMPAPVVQVKLNDEAYCASFTPPPSAGAGGANRV